MTGRVAGQPDAGQWFPDALSGADGMADPAPTMPVLDVYPDALSASMPDDMRRFVRPLDPAATLAGVPADAGPGRQLAGAYAPPQQRPAPRAAQPPAGRPRTTGGRPAQPRTAVPRPAAPAQRQPVVRQAPVRPNQPRPAAAQVAAPATYPSPGRSAGDMVANVRAAFTTQQQNQGAVASHQYQPRAVAPAPPSPRPGQANMQQFRRQAQRAARTKKSSGSGAIAVLIFIVVVLFATGLGERIITMLTALFQK